MGERSACQYWELGQLQGLTAVVQDSLRSIQRRNSHCLRCISAVREYSHSTRWCPTDHCPSSARTYAVSVQGWQKRRFPNYTFHHPGLHYSFFLVLISPEVWYCSLVAWSRSSGMQPSRSARATSGLLCTDLIPLGFLLAQLREATATTRGAGVVSMVFAISTTAGQSRYGRYSLLLG